MDPTYTLGSASSPGVEVTHNDPAVVSINSEADVIEEGVALFPDGRATVTPLVAKSD